MYQLQSSFFTAKRWRYETNARGACRGLPASGWSPGFSRSSICVSPSNRAPKGCTPTIHASHCKSRYAPDAGSVFPGGLIVVLLSILAVPADGDDPNPREFRVWATSCSHVPADIRKGRESLAKAIRQSEGFEKDAPAFDWDVMIDAGDLSAHQFPPGDRDGKELHRQYRTMKKHRREQVYNVPGNHDAPYYDHGLGSWFRKWGDPLGENTAYSGVDPSRRPFPVEGSWERYRFQAGNLLFLMLSDRNDAPTPVGRGHSSEANKGGFPAGAVTRETFRWWKRQVLENQDKIIITMHHHVLRDTTVASGAGEGHPRYHGDSGGGEGSSYLYYLIEKDDPNDFQFTRDAHVFEDFLAEFQEQNGRGAIDLWIGGHTHVKDPDDHFGAKTITETRWGVHFLQVAALTLHHAGADPLSRLLTFRDGSDKLDADVYVHEQTHSNHPVGFYQPAAKSLSLRHPFDAPPSIQPMSTFPASAKVFNETYVPPKTTKPSKRKTRSANSTADESIGVVIERNVDVPMRDGIKLRANVFKPDRGGPYPVLVMQTPYGKPNKGLDRYVKAGYIVLSVDARGRYASEGQWESFVRAKTHDAEDGYDVVQWAAKLPNSNGKVGTFGASYNAFLQWKLAPLRPPALVCMAAFSIPARYTDLEGPGTIRPGRRLHWWITNMTPDMRVRSGRDGETSKSVLKKRWTQGDSEKWLGFLPWSKLPRNVFEEESEAVQYWLKRPHTDPWKLHEGIKDISVPNLDMIGWYDHCNGDMLLNRKMVAEAKTEVARTGSKTFIGPWAHVGRGTTRYGKIDFGPNAKVDSVGTQIRWFDYWLKGKQNGVENMAPFRIFVMGDNQWRDEPHWPLERAQEKLFRLTSSGHANTASGDGKLFSADETLSAGTDNYTYDPNEPVPSLPIGSTFQIPSDQRPVSDRNDILVYQTQPLTERIEVTGNPVVELHASSSAPDTDFFARLIDVAPDGMARYVSSGLVRARYRDGMDNPSLIMPGETNRYTIRMSATSNAFLPGHRIRLDITSSDFPNYDRNHNTAADQNADAQLVIANQTIHHGGTSASLIRLPWIK